MVKRGLKLTRLVWALGYAFSQSVLSLFYNLSLILSLSISLSVTEPQGNMGRRERVSNSGALKHHLLLVHTSCTAD